ncbi:GRAM domain-containing protein [Geobacter argillaceus]|uniref:GRAM domain-containing protein n=1 Tax=Geobacter argillaceus TaxID=345631 RepID=A0A562V7L6_9BACT|nr:GRAM domain-containing protein [Geobacter argillaceus]TWJ13894.1 GRAM domain-containing protein [Geobacter argillaceus]
MSKFAPEDNEKIHLEGRATHIKSALNVNAGYAFLTSKQLAFVGSNSALTNALNSTPYDSDILFTIPIGDITNVQEGKHGLTKKAIISTKTGDEYSIQFDPHDNWLATS